MKQDFRSCFLCGQVLAEADHFIIDPPWSSQPPLRDFHADPSDPRTVPEQYLAFVKTDPDTVIFLCPGCWSGLLTGK